jgi:hypothetical protein
MGFLGVLVRLVVVAFLYGAVGLFFPVFIAHLAIIGHLPALTLVSFGLFLLSTILFIVFGFGRAVRWTLFLFFLTFAVALGTSLATLEKKYDEENVAALLRNPGLCFVCFFCFVFFLFCFLKKKKKKKKGFALVTGSTRGIGFEVSKELIASGWTGSLFLHCCCFLF